MSHKEFRVLYVLSAVCLVYFFIYSVFYNSASEVSGSNMKPVPIIIIDAGHGGEDGGAVSISGVTESSINLSVAQKLEQLLVFSGIPVHMTRSSENDLHTQGDTIRARKISDLKNRVSFVNQFEHGILISIHQNHFSDSKYTGAQVFYANTDGSKVLAAGMQNLFQSALNQQNRRNAKQIESAYLMKNIHCTGILIECGFLSNPQEDQNLQDSNYQKKIVCVMGSSILRYLEQGSGYIEV